MVKGFLVETPAAGYDADRGQGRRAIGRAGRRASRGRPRPRQNVLPGATSFKDTGRVLTATRSTAAWAALGHAVAAYDAALAYTKQRTQFGIRHIADVEVLHTYEGTETIQTLIVGRDITGVGASA